jgi:hypothetical protein
MANEKRLRLLSITTAGTQVSLGAALTSATAGSSGTITLNGTLNYGDGSIVTIASDQYLPVVVDPDTTLAEEIWITSTPSGSPVTASCIRGAGSSTGAPAHSSGAIVVSGPTPADIPPSIDDIWGGNLGYDYEFNGDTTTLPSGWSWDNQPTGATYTEAYGKGSLWVPNNSGWASFSQALPTQATWSAYYALRLNCNLNNTTMGGPMLAESGGTYISFNLRSNNSIYTDTISPLTSTFGNGDINSLSWETHSRVFVRVTQNSTTSYDFDVSNDGINWSAVTTAYNPSTAFTRIGLAVSSNAGANGIIIDWFRVR